MPAGGKTRQIEFPAHAEPAARAAPQDERQALRELAQRAVNGDRSALQALFMALFPVVHKHLSFVLGFGPLVDDAVQESMLRIHRALPSYRGEAALVTWALAIASRTAAKHARRERKYQAAERAGRTEHAELADLDRVLAGSVYGCDTAASGGELVLLTKALGRLKLKKRLAFVLIAILDCSATEAAEVLGTSPNTAASRYRHARQELLDQVERDASV